MSSWALDVDKTPNEADAEASRWQRHAIYRVPAFIKDVNPKAYRPQVVSLGPFHHGDAALLPMEAHKRRALAHLLRRSGRPLEEFRAAMRGAAEQLESAYRDLDAEWRGDGDGGGGGRERFLDMLVVDGCFLLEAMRVTKDVVAGDGDGAGDYATSDPVFSRHGVLYVMPFIRRDMLLLENQLPLLVLERLVAVMTAKPPSNQEINWMVLRFLCQSPPAGGGYELGLHLHPLAVYRGSLVRRSSHPSDSRDSLDNYQEEAPVIRPAVELHEAGVRFRKSWTDSLRDVWFRRGVLRMPALCVDDSTEYALLNMMAFERLHAGAGNDVAAYVFFMSSVLRSAGDVALLCSEGILQNAVGSDKAVAQMFERMCRDVAVEPESAIVAVHRHVNAYCRRRPSRMCGGAAMHSRRRDECLWTTTWAILAVVLLVVLIVQTIYTVLQFYMLRRR